MPSIPKELQQIDYGARRLGVDRTRFYELVRRKVIPAGVIVRLGRHIRVNPEVLEEFINAGGAALPGGWRREPSQEAPENSAL